jgi:hypothetical protein
VVLRTVAPALAWALTTEETAEADGGGREA